MGPLLILLGLALIGITAWATFGRPPDEIAKFYQISMVLFLQNALPITCGIILIGFGGVISSLENLEKHMAELKDRISVSKS